MTLKYIKMITGAMVALAISGAGLAQAASVPGPLVDSAWLEANQGNVVILDVRKDVKSFSKAGHIAGSALINWGKEARATIKEDGAEYIKMIPTKANFEKLMRAKGVNNDSAVVIITKGTKPSEVFFGTRMYWQLKYYGHDNVTLLNGGLAQWMLDKKPVSKDASNAAVGNFSASAERTEMLTTTNQAVSAQKAGTQFVDGRTLDYHLGVAQKKKYVYAAGHIPGSKLLPNDVVLTHGKALKFRSKAELQGITKAMGINASGNNISYCNSGHLGSGSWFILSEILGNKKATLYDGSLHAWTTDKSRPMVTMVME